MHWSLRQKMSFWIIQPALKQTFAEASVGVFHCCLVLWVSIQMPAFRPKNFHSVVYTVGPPPSISKLCISSRLGQNCYSLHYLRFFCQNMQKVPALHFICNASKKKTFFSFLEDKLSFLPLSLSLQRRREIFSKDSEFSAVQLTYLPSFNCQSEINQDKTDLGSLLDSLNISLI